MCSNEPRQRYWNATRIGMHSAGTQTVLWCSLYCDKQSCVITLGAPSRKLHLTGDMLTSLLLMQLVVSQHVPLKWGIIPSWAKLWDNTFQASMHMLLAFPARTALYSRNQRTAKHKCARGHHHFRGSKRQDGKDMASLRRQQNATYKRHSIILGWQEPQ